MYSDKTLLGQGKCGPVYRATHPQSGQPVLLKILPPDGAASAPLDPELVVQQAAQWAQVGGFNIARLLAVEPLEEGLGIVSEYVSGPTIANYPQKGNIGAADALDIANQMLNALVSGEKLRQIHGDIKPSNVLIASQPDGRPHVKLTDWGLNQTRAVHPLETYLFMAPERLDGSGPTLRSDLFSVGNVLFFLLTGMALVKGRTPQEIAGAWKTASPDHLKKIRKDLPAKLVKFVLTLLELKPDKRPSNPSAAMKLLAELNPPSLPQPPPPSTRPITANRPAKPNTVPVQAPMQAPATIPAPGQARPPAIVPTDDVVPIVAMRPPPEIAAQLHLPASVIHAAPEPLASGMQTQPFITGPQTAIPQGTRTQPMTSRANVAQATAHPRQVQVSRRQAPPPKKSALIPILTIVVLLATVAGGVYVFMNWDQLKTKFNTESEETPEKKSTSDLMEQFKKSGKK